MNFLTHLLSPATMKLMALTLLHFLWQGNGLRRLGLCRRWHSAEPPLPVM